MRGFTFIRQTKLHDVCGRVNYISSHEEQEHLYATYETSPEPFWEDLARECQAEFKKSGALGKCIEARELVIALPKSLQEFNPNELLKYFTEEFKKQYGVECSSALHHNPRRTNYHIHLIYSERTLLDEPIKKVAGRNLFFNSEGKKVRAKKDIHDADGNLLPGCHIVPNGSKTRASGTQILLPFVRSPCSFHCFLPRLLRKSLRQHPQTMSIKKQCVLHQETRSVAACSFAAVPKSSNQSFSVCFREFKMGAQS